jgi:hypothetical protein
MTTPTRKPSHAGTCPLCGRETGNLTRHTPACRRKQAEMPTQRAVQRSAAHVVPEGTLTALQRPQGAVSDLNIARLMRALESGVLVYQGGRYGWKCDGGLPLAQRTLGNTVTEAVRVGLVRAISEPTGPQVRKVFVVPAPVHLRTMPSRPLCRWNEPPGVIRYRLTDDRGLADCDACLAY